MDQFQGLVRFKDKSIYGRWSSNAFKKYLIIKCFGEDYLDCVTPFLIKIILDFGSFAKMCTLGLALASTLSAKHFTLTTHIGCGQPRCCVYSAIIIFFKNVISIPKISILAAVSHNVQRTVPSSTFS